MGKYNALVEKYLKPTLNNPSKSRRIN